MLNAEQLKGYAKTKLYLNTNLLITDNNYIEIDNCKKVLEYNDIFLKIKSSNMIIQIWGKNLSINDYNSGGIVVKGEIDSVEFLKKQV